MNTSGPGLVKPIISSETMPTTWALRARSACAMTLLPTSPFSSSAKPAKRTEIGNPVSFRTRAISSIPATPLALSSAQGPAATLS